MNIFDNFNESTVCYICNTSKPGKAVLIPLDNTKDENLEQCIQVHLDCLKLRCLKIDTEIIIYQKNDTLGISTKEGA